MWPQVCSGPSEDDMWNSRQASAPRLYPRAVRTHQLLPYSTWPALSKGYGDLFSLTSSFQPAGIIQAKSLYPHCLKGGLQKAEAIPNEWPSSWALHYPEMMFSGNFLTTSHYDRNTNQATLFVFNNFFHTQQGEGIFPKFQERASATKFFKKVAWSVSIGNGTHIYFYTFKMGVFIELNWVVFSRVHAIPRHRFLSQVIPTALQ